MCEIGFVIVALPYRRQKTAINAKSICCVRLLNLKVLAFY
jgi:hypothetical protein